MSEQLAVIASVALSFMAGREYERLLRKEKDRKSYLFRCRVHGAEPPKRYKEGM